MDCNVFHSFYGSREIRSIPSVCSSRPTVDPISRLPTMQTLGEGGSRRNFFHHVYRHSETSSIQSSCSSRPIVGPMSQVPRLQTVIKRAWACRSFQLARSKRGSQSPVVLGPWLQLAWLAWGCAGRPGRWKPSAGALFWSFRSKGPQEAPSGCARLLALRSHVRTFKA